MSSRFERDAEARLGAAIPITRYRHDSGLTLVLCPDSTSPLVSVQTWYRVGSADEQLGQTGIAHLFEHLMFNQTETLDPGELDRAIEATGGDCNAATSLDWTFYRMTLPSTELDLGVGLEAERMTRLVLDETTLEAEREVVINERLETVDHDVDGFLDEQLASAAFPTHPYGRPTIGFMDDIKRLDLAAIRSFYRTYYAPNNATLVIVGDVDPGAALASVDRHFGGIGRSDIPPRRLTAEADQSAERRCAYSKPTAAAKLLCGYRVPGQRHADWPALALLAGLLSAGQSARLYERLVIDRELATYAESDVMPVREPSLLRIAIGGTLGASLDDIAAETDEVIAELLADVIADAEVDKVRSGTETDFWSELETADGKGEALGHYETVMGDFRELFAQAERLASVTSADLSRVARTYLRSERRSVVAAVPDAGELGARDWERP